MRQWFDLGFLTARLHRILLQKAPLARNFRLAVILIVERDTYLDEIRARISLARAGRGQIVLVSGEAGIGKTSILHALIDTADPKETWAWGGCDPLITPRPLGPLYDMASSLDPKTLELLNALDDRASLYSQIVSVLENKSELTVLVFEDVHWADYATLDLIRFLARRITFMRVAILISFRTDAMDENNYIRQVVGELPAPSTYRVDIGPLSQKAVETLAQKAGVETNGLYQATEGNPFFVTELIAARKTLGNDLPSSIRDAVSAQLARLPEKARDLLELISVFPNAVPISRLETIIDDQALEYIDLALQRGLIEQDKGGAIRFRHSLVRRSTLERLPATRRRDLHRRVFENLISNSNGFSIDQIVHHAAGALDGAAVLKFAPEAARQASRAGAHHEAAAQFAIALRFVDDADPEQAATLYESWAYEASLAARIDDEVLDARRTAITLWKMLERPEKVSENLRGLSRLHWYRGESIEATKFADQAIKVSEGTPPSSEHAMAYSLRSQLLMLNDQMDEAVTFGKQALALEAAFPDPEVRMHALNNVGSALAFRDDPAGVTMLEESLSLAISLNHQEHAARAYNNLAEYAVEFRRFDLAERTLSDGLAYDTERDLDSWTYYLSGRLAQLRLDQGRLRDAETISQGVMNQERLTLLMKLPAALVLSRTRLRLGHDDALTILQNALNDALATDELQHIVPARLSMLEASWLLNKPNLAAEHLQALWNLSEADRHPWNIGALAVWCRRLEQDSKFDTSSSLPEPHRLELDGDFDSAGKAWQALGLPYEAALAFSQEKTPVALAKSLDILQGMEANLAASKIRKLAKKMGFEDALPKTKRGPYKEARDHPLGLTLKEQKVLSLLMKGLTNREMAEAMSRSQRTVEHHVSSILKKLNATSRMAVILRVQNEPWLVEQS